MKVVGSAALRANSWGAPFWLTSGMKLSPRLPVLQQESPLAPWDPALIF